VTDTTGSYRHLVTVQHPAPTAVANGDGGYVAAWVDATPPTWHVAITSPTGSQERSATGTTLAPATHVLTGRYRADITVRSRIVLNTTRVLSIIGVAAPLERGVGLVVTCIEIEPGPPDASAPEGGFSQPGFSQPDFDQTYG
jgi:head-tail adaptor